MAGVDVVAASPDGVFTVTVRSDGTTTEHRVVVPPGYLEEMGVDASDPARAVRASFDFLLEWEPATSILERFDLPTITRYFPQYPDELRRRLA